MITEDWVRLSSHDSKTWPDCGISVVCKSCDRMGEYTYVASRKAYKKPPTRSMRYPWRFVDDEGERVETPQYWRYKRNEG
jgi:hypothetical protein